MLDGEEEVSIASGAKQMTDKRQSFPSPSRTAGSFGRYVLSNKFAHGGMAEVYLGREAKLNSRDSLVIKRILPELSHQPQFLAMFLNEAQLAAQMKHPNIVSVVDFGEIDGCLYMVMEYVNGLDCWRFAKRLHPWGNDHEALAVWIICKVLGALEYAHNMTDVNSKPLLVVHRDLSPSNIYLSLDGRVKLGDFGIARIESDRYQQIKMIPKGKFGYVAPEQVEGSSFDNRADIFAIGIVLTELLIGKKMFSGPSQLSVMLEITEGRLDNLEQNVHRISGGLLEILYRALARNPADRFGSAAEFGENLLAYLESENRVPTESELANQVCRAVDLNDLVSDLPGQDHSRTSLTNQVTPPAEFDYDPLSSGPPTAPFDVKGVSFHPKQQLIGSPLFLGATPTTVQDMTEHSEWLYTVRLPNGKIVGPTPFAHIIELICSDRIGPDTFVSTNGKDFVAACTRPELARHLPAYTPTWETEKTKVPDRRGTLDLESPCDVTLTLALKKETGMLVCSRNTMRKEVYFRDGVPLYVTSNESDELLGEYLVSTGIITRSDLETALSLLPKFSGHLGDTIIALGLLSGVQLFHHIAEQIRTRFISLLGWGHGAYVFYRGVPCRTDVLELMLNPFEIISEYLASRSIEMDVDMVIDHMIDSMVAQSSKGEKLEELLNLSPQVAEILDLVQEPQLLRHIIQHFPDMETTVQFRSQLVQALFIALETGIWLLEGPTPPWRFEM